ncbi:hypothetical protein ACPA9J_00275 [Pseudomonas aeruginosa]
MPENTRTTIDRTRGAPASYHRLLIRLSPAPTSTSTLELAPAGAQRAASGRRRPLNPCRTPGRSLSHGCSPGVPGWPAGSSGGRLTRVHRPVSARTACVSQLWPGARVLATPSKSLIVIPGGDPGLCRAGCDYADGTWDHHVRMQLASTRSFRATAWHRFNCGSLAGAITGRRPLRPNKGRLFSRRIGCSAAPTMFARSASRHRLVRHLRDAGFVFIDRQMPTRHLQPAWAPAPSAGGIRRRYLQSLVAHQPPTGDLDF